MDSINFNKLSDKSRVGIKPTLEATEATDTTQAYAEFEIKRLTRSSSFMAHGETFYIGKKNPQGKATKIYHVYRVSDKKYVCPSVLEKEETIMYVMSKYGDWLDERD